MPADIDYVREHYVDNLLGIRCTLAEDHDGTILGFQSLIRAVDGNPYGTPVGWGSLVRTFHRMPHDAVSEPDNSLRVNRLRSVRD